MTIRNRELNNRLTNLEYCAQNAPERTYERAKQAAEAIEAASNGIIQAFRDRGFVCPNNDLLRDVEAAIYGLLLAGNPEEHELMTAEGWGEHIHNPMQRERMIRQTIRDRDELEQISRLFC